MTRPDESLAPSRRSRRTGAPAPHTSDYSDDEVARGQAAALLGALGRLQLRFDTFARQQAHAIEQLEAKVDGLQRTIDELTVVDE